jgi:hypothetical protein
VLGRTGTFSRIVRLHAQFLQVAKERPDGRKFTGNGGFAVAAVQVRQESAQLERIDLLRMDLGQAFGRGMGPVGISGGVCRKLHQIMAISPQRMGRIALFGRQALEEHMDACEQR